ncbi:MAG: type IX secretion system membrane protein PorP/SprF, partial [Saprospiraceae bacterium]
AIAVLAGFKLSESIKLAYAYDFTLSNLSTVSSGSHEIMLNYNLGKPIGKGRPPKIIYNPRSL